jgi:iron(III) transport system substrate-binding protein
MSHSRRRRTPHSLVVVLGAVLAGTLTLTACSDGSTAGAGAGSSAAPSSADPLVVYSGRSESLVGPLLEQFSEETGIETEIRYGDSAELAAQLVEEGEQSPADVFLAQDAGALGAVSAEGMFGPIPEASLDLVPQQYSAEDGTWVGVTGRSRVIAYDAEQVPTADVPESVYELTDPKWSGQVAIAPTNASFQSFVTAMRLTDGDEKTQAWLQGLVDNDVKTYEKNGLILDAVDAGQVKLGLINHYYWYEKASEVGADAMRAQIAFAKPGDPGALVNVSGAGILTGGAGESADTFVAYLLSPAAQTYFATETFEYPLIEGVAAPDGLPGLASLQGPPVPLEKLEELPATQEMLRNVGLI